MNDDNDCVSLPAAVRLPVQGAVPRGRLEGVRPDGRVQAPGNRHLHPSPATHAVNENTSF